MELTDKEKQLKLKVKKMLISAGVDDESSDYLGDLYATSEQGKLHTKTTPAPAASCGTGIIPIL